jgi:hypothetical protein
LIAGAAVPGVLPPFTKKPYTLLKILIFWRATPDDDEHYVYAVAL